MAAAGWLAGLRGLPLAVMVVAASLPVGANVFLFSQRYRKAEDLVTASVAVSTVLALVQRVAGDGAVAETARLIKAPAARAPRPHPPPSRYRSRSCRRLLRPCQNCQVSGVRR
jgi:hypothetical protein